MGLCFGKPCSRSAAVTHRSPEKRSSSIAINGGRVVHVHKDHHQVSHSGFRREADLHFPATISTFVPSPSGTSKHCTFQQLLSREHIFELNSGSFGRNVELPSTKRDSCRDYVREPNQVTMKNFSAFQNAAVEFHSEAQLPSEHSWSSAEMTVSDSVGDAESVSSFRGGKTPSTCEDNDLRYTKSTYAVAGSNSPLISSLKSKAFNPEHAYGSSGEIIEETGSELSVSNTDLYIEKSSKSETKSDHEWLTAEKVALVDSRSSSQDVMSLEFLEEICRVSGVTSQSSSCSEADFDGFSPKVMLAGMHSCTRPSINHTASAEEGSASKVMLDGLHSCTRPSTNHRVSGAGIDPMDAAGVDLTFMDFLCSQGQVLAREIAPIDEAPIPDAGPPSSSRISKKRPSKSYSEVMSESATKKPRFSNEENRTVALVPEMGLAEDVHELDSESPAKQTYAETYHAVRALRLRDMKSAPSTPGSFPSTPFASVGSSFSLEDMGSIQKLVSPSTPASFASLGSTPNFAHTSSAVLTIEEMAAIWGAFEEGRMMQ